MAVHTCAAIDCRALVLPFAVFCERCWPLVPADLKTTIGRLHRPRAKVQSGRLQAAVAAAVQELHYLKVTGHYAPSDRSFDWDDTPPAPAPADLKLWGDA